MDRVLGSPRRFDQPRAHPAEDAMLAAPMSDIDRALLSCLRELVTEREDAGVRFHGTMFFPPEMVGPPGRVHGGIHPLVRTLPILARLRGATEPPTRVKIDAMLQKALPLETDVPFDGTYVERDGDFVLETRFLGSDRLRATATQPGPADLPSGPALERFRALYEAGEREPGDAMKVLGTPYRFCDSTVVLDLRTPGQVEPSSHLSKCLREDGSVGLTALCTQLDAIGATGQGAKMRHPHFTTHLTLSFDLEGLDARTPLLVMADRTTIRLDEGEDAPKVDVRGTLYGTAHIEVIAVDATFGKCFAHGFVSAHPVDPSRFAGFEQMRKLREL